MGLRRGGELGVLPELFSEVDAWNGSFPILILPMPRRKAQPQVIVNAPQRIGVPEEFTVERRKILKTTYRPPDAENSLAFILDGVFTPSECEEWIQLTESQGYEPALVNIGAGRQMLMTDIRNNTRCIIDSVEMASRIQKYIQP